MIKNVVFDLGNVLISFKPSEYFDKKQYSGRLKSIIMNDIFHSREWLMLDNGDISLNDAIEGISKKSSLTKEEIARIFDLRTDLMFPLDQNIKLLPELSKRGLKLYFLSNFPLDIWDEVRNGYYFFRYFEGGLISAEARSTKPDPGIYRLLFEKYSLNPTECLYIDDLEANVKAAELFGALGLVADGSDGISEAVKKALNI